jgi:multidrug efflux system membrane fusion protein
VKSPRVLANLALLIALCLVGLTGCTGGKAKAETNAPAPDVAAASVVVKKVDDWNDFNGRLEAVNTVEVHPRVAGHIDSVRFEEGSRVKKGQLLFQIDPRPFQHQVTRLNAEVRRAQSRLDLAVVDHKRAEHLFESGAIPRAEFERLSTADAEASAALDSSRASLALARLDAAFTRISAPIDGRVSRAYVTPGNLVSPSSVLTTLVSDGAIYVYFDVDEATYLGMSRAGEEGKVVRIGLVDEEGYPHRGTLDFVDNQLDTRTGTVRARAVIEKPDERFLPGLFARVRLVRDRTVDAMLVDDKAILTDQDKKYVYVLDKEGRAQRKNIITGRMVEGLRSVQSGLDPKDRVIVHGVQKIFSPGMPVRSHEVAMGAPPPESQPGAR